MEQHDTKTRIYIIRHAQSEANVRNIVQGTIDTPLSPTGIEQAEQIADVLKDVPFDYIYSSPLQRAQQTAKAIAKYHAVPFTVSPEIRERYYGKYEGYPTTEFLALYKEWNTYTDEEKWNHQFADEESQRVLSDRLINFLKTITQEHQGKTIAVISHGGIIRSFLIRIKYGDWDSIAGLTNCGYAVIEPDGETYSVVKAQGVIPWKDIKP